MGALGQEAVFTGMEVYTADVTAGAAWTFAIAKVARGTTCRGRGGTREAA